MKQRQRGARHGSTPYRTPGAEKTAARRGCLVPVGLILVFLRPAAVLAHLSQFGIALLLCFLLTEVATLLSLLLVAALALACQEALPICDQPTWRSPCGWARNAPMRGVEPKFRPRPRKIGNFPVGTRRLAANCPGTCLRKKGANNGTLCAALAARCADSDPAADLPVRRPPLSPTPAGRPPRPARRLSCWAFPVKPSGLRLRTHMLRVVQKRIDQSKTK